MRGTVAKRLRAEARRLATFEAMEVAPYGSRRDWKVVEAPTERNETWHTRLSAARPSGRFSYDPGPQVRWAATSFRGQLRRIKREWRAGKVIPQRQTLAEAIQVAATARRPKP